MAKSKIAWTEKTWNPVTGCTKVSAGCKNCYAERMHKRLTKMGLDKYSEPFSKVVCHEAVTGEPLSWQKPRMVFVNSMSDLFHKDVPFEFIKLVMSIINLTPRHTYQILTKRPERALAFVTDYMEGAPLPDNVWMGVSVENQKAADERIYPLTLIPCKVRWLSMEPLLGPVDLRPFFDLPMPQHFTRSEWGINWVVVGGESGPGARSMDLTWAVYARNQCRQYGVPFFFKQDSQYDSGRTYNKWETFPDELKVREYPVTNMQGAL